MNIVKIIPLTLFIKGEALFLVACNDNLGNMKILILGAKGSLGAQLVKVFAGANDVLAWDKGEVDITDGELILKKIGEIKPELVINAAAYNAVDKCEANDEEYESAKKINIDGPKFLAEACLKNGAVLVHYSTNYVFDGQQKRGYQENDGPKPINRYGKSKFHGEKRILELTGRGLKWFLIRTSKLFGPTGSSEMAKKSFFDLMLELGRGPVTAVSATVGARAMLDAEVILGKGTAAEEEKRLEVVDGEVSCFTYTPDLAKATRELVLSGRGYGIYHLVNSGACTWYQAAVELFGIVQTKVKVVPISGEKLKRPAKRPKYATLLNTKLPPLRDYREALREYLGK